MKVPFKLSFSGLAKKLPFGGKKRMGPTTTQVRAAETTQVGAGLRVLRSIPWFGKLGFQGQARALTWGVMAPALLFAVASLTAGYFLSTFNAERVQLATTIQMNSQRLANLAGQASSGNALAFRDMARVRKMIQADLSVLDKGQKMMPPVTGQPRRHLEKVKTKWGASSGYISQNLITLVSSLGDFSKNLQLSDEKIRAVRAQMPSDAIQTKILTETFMLYLSNAASNANTLISAKVVTGKNFESLSANVVSAGEIIKVLLDGNNKIPAVKSPEVRAALEAIQPDLEVVVKKMNVLKLELESLAEDRLQVQVLVDTSEEMLNVANLLTRSLTNESVLGQLGFILGMLLAGVSTVAMLLLIWLRLKETQMTSARIEESIMFLMNDLGSIADGDFTVRARVTEDITGAISDSLNYTVANLGDTLTAVRASSDKVSTASADSKDLAEAVQEAVADQTNSIKAASASVLDITKSIAEVASGAEQSAEVARLQVSATQEGKQAVGDAITAMGAIREQIQETSKRIKRLGESSQEIGEIVELISDTTEQTNVLALNASIQAAAAGEAGRGFRAVATEVQRLAERSESSLKRISALISGIQADTQNAVAAMERSTQQVVEGASVTNRAGDALNKIDQVSSQLSDLIQRISEATAVQNKDAGHVSDGMSEILSIAEATAGLINDAASEMIAIADMSQELRASVSGFKL